MTATDDPRVEVVARALSQKFHEGCEHMNVSACVDLDWPNWAGEARVALAAADAAGTVPADVAGLVERLQARRVIGPHSETGAYTVLIPDRLAIEAAAALADLSERLDQVSRLSVTQEMLLRDAERERDAATAAMSDELREAYALVEDMRAALKEARVAIRSGSYPPEMGEQVEAILDRIDKLLNGSNESHL